MDRGFSFDFDRKWLGLGNDTYGTPGGGSQGMRFGGSNMNVVNELMAQRAAGVPAAPAQEESQGSPFWDAFRAKVTGRDPSGNRTDKSTAQQEQFYGALDSLSNRFQNIGGGPIGPLPRPYAGPPVTMGRNQGAGLQSLIAQLLGGARR